MEFVVAILDILKSVGRPVCKYVEYHRKLDENMEKLKSMLQELNSQKEDTEETLKAQSDRGRKAKNEVDNWLRNVKKINDETDDIEKEVNKGRYFSRARLGKLVQEKIEKVQEYQQKGRFFTSTSLVIDVAPAPPKGVILPAKQVVGERNKKIVEEIWKHLMSDKITKVGVYGMGGIGKTTIMTLINNKLQKEAHKFDHVIWLTVSQTLDHMKLQNDIAKALHKDLEEKEAKIKRAGELLQILEGKRFVLILDDMWEAFSLEEVGIPEPTEDNGCKLVITTRSMDVCRSMSVAEVRVQPLTKEEALNLFLDKVGRSILEVPTLKEIVESVVEECAGLPLAIVTIAGCMKGVHEIHEWRNALNELSRHVRSVRGTDADVFGRLEFSYNRLKDEKVQHCFLYCALYPEDFVIPKDELIDYWIADGILDEVENVQAKYDRGRTMLDRLVNNCLLESAYDGPYVKMHDLIRDMALRITSKSPLFMTKAGINLQNFPSAEEWKENLQKASLMKNQIKEIPSNMSPNCPCLSALFLQWNGFWRIPKHFLVHMQGLKILDLSDTNISVLPDSVSDLINLRSLLLRNCAFLRRIPSLKKLSALQYLDFHQTSIEGVPEGLEKLKKLISLNLICERLEEFPSAILPNLHSLFKLRVYWGRFTLPKTVEEAAKLSNQLDSFDGIFRRVNDFNIFVKSLGGRGPKRYRLVLYDISDQDLDFEPLSDSIRYGRKLILDEVDKMVGIMHCNIFEREGRIVCPKDVQHLSLIYIQDLERLNDFLSGDNEEGAGAYSSLRSIEIYYCNSLKEVFSPQLLSTLQTLEVIELHGRLEIEEIIAVNRVDGKEQNGKKELGRNSITSPFPD
ncbi:Disease resistance protein [Melia azedarach]|uniref:Disease resistance protein n=1 Tax=Melia azedarach TaxID=155640 RepID=A0ACC1Y5H2_MELAZ|nr:Disease resistance protein [Melia azedarach]